jgi:bifunctional UDP-N-acetylglucosamine pyrophosphorylase/glucosamine-1-phosphate N-acetyltransferase
VVLEHVKAIVLAAGGSDEMRSSRPKVLHELAGRPILTHVLGALREAGIDSVALLAEGDVPKIAAAAGEGVRTLAGGFDAAAGLLADAEGDVLVVRADAPLVRPQTLEGMVRGLRERRADAVLLSACCDDPRGYARVTRDPEGRFRAVVEEADATEEQRKLPEVSPGAFAFRAAPLREALRTLKPSGFGAVLTAWAAAGRPIETARPADMVEVYVIRNRKDLVAATNFLRWRELERHLSAGVTVVDPSTTYIEADVQIGADTVIHPFCVIRAGVRIGSGCEVGPFAHLRGGSVLADGAEVGDFVELKNTRLGARSKAKHLSYLGDAVVGAGVNIGAGTITANYDGKTKNPTTIEDGAFTGCHTVLVAPVTMKKNSKTGAGAVVPRGQDVPEGTTVVGVPARPLGKRRGS